MKVDELNSKYESMTPQSILEWALKAHRSSVGISSSFGGQSAVLLHMAVQIDRSVPILFLNTGFLFKETLQYVEELKKKLNLNVREFKATPQQIEQTRKNLETKKTTGICCDEAKVSLMEQSLAGLTCWITGLRRSQGGGREAIKIIEESRPGLVKVSPLANWTSKEMYSYMKDHNLPFHPLWEKGYTSIGCEPCTSLPIPGQGERSGRWAGQDKTECGIHTFLERK